MARIDLTEQDIDYIGRVVATEVPGWIQRNNPQEYERMVGAVVDTILNRVETARFGTTVEEVLNQDRAFSKINGPAKLDPYGSVDLAPAASARVQATVNKHISDRTQGKPSEIKGAVNYANPYYSDKKNRTGWIDPMIEDGALKLGRGKAVHYHGNAPGQKPASEYEIGTPEGWFPPVDPSVRPWSADIPLPTSRENALHAQGLQDMAASMPGMGFDGPFDFGGYGDLVPPASFNIGGTPAPASYEGPFGPAFGIEPPTFAPPSVADLSASLPAHPSWEGVPTPPSSFNGMNPAGVTIETPPGGVPYENPANLPDPVPSGYPGGMYSMPSVTPSQPAGAHVGGSLFDPSMAAPSFANPLDAALAEKALMGPMPTVSPVPTQAPAVPSSILSPVPVAPVQTMAPPVAAPITVAQPPATVTPQVSRRPTGREIAREAGRGFLRAGVPGAVFNGIRTAARRDNPGPRGPGLFNGFPDFGGMFDFSPAVGPGTSIGSGLDSIMALMGGGFAPGSTAYSNSMPGASYTAQPWGGYSFTGPAGVTEDFDKNGNTMGARTEGGFLGLGGFFN